MERICLQKKYFAADSISYVVLSGAKRNSQAHIRGSQPNRLAFFIDYMIHFIFKGLTRVLPLFLIIHANVVFIQSYF